MPNTTPPPSLLIRNNATSYNDLMTKVDEMRQWLQPQSPEQTSSDELTLYFPALFSNRKERQFELHIIKEASPEAKEAIIQAVTSNAPSKTIHALHNIKHKAVCIFALVITQAHNAIGQRNSSAKAYFQAITAEDAENAVTLLHKSNTPSYRSSRQFAQLDLQNITKYCPLTFANKRFYLATEQRRNLAVLPIPSTTSKISEQSTSTEEGRKRVSDQKDYSSTEQKDTLAPTTKKIRLNASTPIEDSPPPYPTPQASNARTPSPTSPSIHQNPQANNSLTQPTTPITPTNLIIISSPTPSISPDAQPTNFPFSSPTTSSRTPSLTGSATPQTPEANSSNIYQPTALTSQITPTTPTTPTHLPALSPQNFDSASMSSLTINKLVPNPEATTYQVESQNKSRELTRQTYEYFSSAPPHSSRMQTYSSTIPETLTFSYIRNSSATLSKQQTALLKSLLSEVQPHTLDISAAFLQGKYEAYRLQDSSSQFATTYMKLLSAILNPKYSTYLKSEKKGLLACSIDREECLHFYIVTVDNNPLTIQSILLLSHIASTNNLQNYKKSLQEALPEYESKEKAFYSMLCSNKQAYQAIGSIAFYWKTISTIIPIESNGPLRYFYSLPQNPAMSKNTNQFPPKFLTCSESIIQIGNIHTNILTRNIELNERQTNKKLHDIQYFKSSIEGSFHMPKLPRRPRAYN